METVYILYLEDSLQLFNLLILKKSMEEIKMKKIIRTFFVLNIVLCFCCNKESDKNNEASDNKNEAIELRDNFSETEFKNALIGEWRSVFELAGKENVIYLKFDNQGKARIIIEKDSVEKEYSGDYTVDFLREPAEEMMTIARIIISSSDKEIVLSWVNFGLHNAFPADYGLFLRIEKPPYGVLERIE